MKTDRDKRGAPPVAREARFKERKKRKRFSVLKKIFVVAAIAVALAFILNSQIFDVSVIEIDGAVKVTDQEVYNAGVTKGVNIFSVSSGKCKSLISRDPYVKSVDITKVFPDKIVVTITERKARAYVEYKSMSQYILVDETGVALGVSQYAAEKLPIAAGLTFDGYTIGKQIDASPLGAFETVVELAGILDKYAVDDADKIDVSDLSDIKIIVGLHTVDIGDMTDADAKIGLYAAARKLPGFPSAFPGTFDVKNPNKAYWSFVN